MTLLAILGPAIVAAACATTKVELVTPEEWDVRDRAALATARRTCREKYKSCLVKFIRVEPGRYHAVCGGRK